MSSYTEAYENGWYSGEKHYISNLATLKLKSNNTGLWLIGNVRELFNKATEKLSEGWFYYEFFDDEDDPISYNDHVLAHEENGVLPLAFAKSTFLDFKNVYVSGTNYDKYTLAGNIWLCAEHTDGTIERVFKIPRITIFSKVPFFLIGNPISGKAKVRLTMDAVDVWKLTKKEWYPSKDTFTYTNPMGEEQEENVTPRKSRGLSSLFKS